MVAPSPVVVVQGDKGQGVVPGMAPLEVVVVVSLNYAWLDWCPRRPSWVACDVVTNGRQLPAGFLVNTTF